MRNDKRSRSSWLYHALSNVSHLHCEYSSCASFEYALYNLTGKTHRFVTATRRGPAVSEGHYLCVCFQEYKENPAVLRYFSNFKYEFQPDYY